MIYLKSICLIGILLIVDMCPAKIINNKDDVWTKADFQSRQSLPPDTLEKVERFAQDQVQIIDFTIDEKEHIFLSFVAEEMKEPELRDAVNKRELIEKIQKEFDLPITGEIDAELIELALSPRCGTTRTFNKNKRKWLQKHLKYSIFNYSPDMSQCQIRNVLRKSFRVWEEATDLTFEEVSTDNNPDIRIRFRYGRHKDEYKPKDTWKFKWNTFDEACKTLAHAFSPKTGILHFNEACQWTPDGAPVVVTYNGNSDGAPCSFPFQYNGQKYEQCITQDDGLDWCATTSDYTKDGKWGLCQHPRLYTFGGNSNGQACVFPFRFKSKDYNDCTDVDVDATKENRYMWCSTTSDYDKDEKWGYCPQRKNGVLKSAKSYSMLYTAVHEIGHAIGFEHSTKRESIMYEKIRRGIPVKLSQEDIKEVEQWYGKRNSILPDIVEEKCGGKIDGVFPPVTPPTTKATTTTTRKPNPLCKLNSVDAALSTKKDNYFFEGSMLWKVEKSDFPSFRNVQVHKITDWFKGGPSSVDAAYMASDGEIVLFNDRNFWRFRDLKLTKGPESVTTLRLSRRFLNAVVPRSFDKILIYYPRYHIEYNPNTKEQKAITIWENYSSPDAALAIDQDHTVFFKNQKVYKVNLNKMVIEDKMDLKTYFRC